MLHLAESYGNLRGPVESTESCWILLQPAGLVDPVEFLRILLTLGNPLNPVDLCSTLLDHVDSCRLLVKAVGFC